MMKGALAMVVATQYPEAVKTKRAGSSVAEQQFPIVKKARLAEARTVIAYAGELVDQVITGGMSLDANDPRLAVCIMA